MQETVRAKTPVLFWVVAAVLLLWGIAGSLIYINFFIKTPAEFAEASETPENREAYADYLANIPAWALFLTIGAALTRLLGACSLLLRRTWAEWLYLVSVILFAGALFRAFVLANAADVMSGPHIGTQVVFLALGVFAFWFARWSKSRRLLR